MPLKKKKLPIIDSDQKRKFLQRLRENMLC